MYEKKKILILGMARSGYECAKLLANQNEIIITDQNNQEESRKKELKEMNVSFIETKHPEELLDQSFHVVIKNPGIAMNHPLIQKAMKLNIPIVNEMEVAYHYLPKNVKIIGVTGSNGKTTTTTLIYEILKKMQIPVHLGGNIGIPLSALIKDIKEGDTLLLEISDHQLLNFKDFKTNISVLTNLSPTHLDFHGSYEAYKNVKKKIFEHHTTTDLAIINGENKDALEITESILSKKEWFKEKNAYIKKNAIYINEEKIIELKNILLKGMHNYENIMACLLVIKEYGIQKEIIEEVLSQFGGVEHRLEFVTEQNGISYYNDSKSTNPVATITALNSFQTPVLLILGGMERQQNFDDLKDYMKYVKQIYAIGETRNRIEEFAKKRNIPCTKQEFLKDIMPIIQKDAEKGDTVLLSPASASWDQYDKFETRGEEFKKLIKPNK